MHTISWTHHTSEGPKFVRPRGWNFTNFLFALLQISVIVAILL